jgi:predicted nucleic acid-binding protein
MVIADTGFFVALGNRKDDYHELSRQRLSELSAQGERLVTTCAVMTEASYLIFQRGGRNAQRNFIGQYQIGLWDVFELNALHASRIDELMEKYADRKLAFA